MDRCVSDVDDRSQGTLPAEKCRLLDPTHHSLCKGIDAQGARTASELGQCIAEQGPAGREVLDHELRFHAKVAVGNESKSHFPAV